MGKKISKKKKTNGHFKIAIIDIGSNSVRLVAFKVKKKSAETLENNKHICQLGKLDSNGNIPEEKQKLAFAAFKEFSKFMKKEGIDHIIPVATAAARNANNGAAFIEKAERKLGHKIRVLSAEEEARYAALGVIASRSGKGFEVDINGVVADLGGGSMELARVKDNEVIDGISTKLGTLILRKQNDPRTHIQETFDGIDESYAKADNLYVIGGSWRAVRKTWQKNHEDSEDRSKALDTPDMTAIPTRGVKDHIKHILDLESQPPADEKTKFPKSLNESAKALFEEFPSIGADRANRIFDACRLLDELIDKTKAKNVIFVESGLREGLIYHYVMQSILTLEAARVFSQMHDEGDNAPDVEAEDNPAAQIGMVAKPESCAHDA